MIKIQISGIYKITNKITEEYYIGMSVDIFSRWSSHYTDIKMKKHSSTKFMELWNKSNPTDWTFEILECVSKTNVKLECNLKGKAFDTYFRRILLKKEKEHMKLYSKTYALNKDNKSFS